MARPCLLACLSSRPSAPCLQLLPQPSPWPPFSSLWLPWPPRLPLTQRTGLPWLPPWPRWEWLCRPRPLPALLQPSHWQAPPLRQWLQRQWRRLPWTPSQACQPPPPCTACCSQMAATCASTAMCAWTCLTPPTWMAGACSSCCCSMTQQQRQSCWAAAAAALVGATPTCATAGQGGPCLPWPPRAFSLALTLTLWTLWRRAWAASPGPSPLACAPWRTPLPPATPCQPCLGAASRGRWCGWMTCGPSLQCQRSTCGPAPPACAPPLLALRTPT